MQDTPRSIRQDSKNDQRVVLLSVLCEGFLFVVGLIFVSSFVVVVVKGDIFNSHCLAVLSLGVYSFGTSIFALHFVFYHFNMLFFTTLLGKTIF